MLNIEKGHTSKEKKMENVFEICIDKCEQTVNAAQKLVDTCSLSNLNDCAKQVGIAAGRAQQCIDACTEAVKHARKWLERAKDATEKKKLDWAIKKAQDCIDACQRLVAECTKGNADCIKRCSTAIEACNKCAQACSDLV